MGTLGLARKWHYQLPFAREEPMNTTRSTVVRRLRAALFQVRAVLVFLVFALGIVAWMLAGIVAAALAGLLRGALAACRSGAAGRSAVGIGVH